MSCRLRNFKLTIEYDGTDFNGWQVQGGKTRTVQAVIETALTRIFKKKTPLTGSGRTDSGVHAVGQVAHFQASTALDPRQVQKALNANLPPDIVILQVQNAAPTFHARFRAKKKTYRYTILNREFRCALNRQTCHHIARALNVTAMRRAAKGLEGKKDFRCFMAADPAFPIPVQERPTVRRIHRILIKKRGDWLTIDIQADGFLYKMARNIVGTLLEVGAGRRKPADIEDILRGQDRKKAGVTAPAHGLCLISVEY